MRALWSTLVAVGLFAMLGCETQQQRSPQFTEPVVAGVPLVEMGGFNFVPARITVATGDTVEWRNTTRTAHTVTCHPQYAANPQNIVLPEGALPFHSGTLQPGESFFHTFQTPGQYRYVCLIHEHYGMIAEVTVVEPYVNIERGPQRPLNGWE